MPRSGVNGTSILQSGNTSSGIPARAPLHKMGATHADATGSVCSIMLTTELFMSQNAGHALQGAVIPGLQQARQGYKDREVRLTGERFRVENRLADLVEAERCQFQENLQLEHRVGAVENWVWRRL